MKTLVTGATGFLGLYVVEQLLAQGESVRAMCRKPTRDLERLGVEIALGDIRDASAVDKACEGVDTIHHTAGVAGIWGPWKHYYETNTLGTEHIVASALRHGVSKLVYTSSPSVTFDGKPQDGVDESAPYPTRWLCHYPHSKALGEQAALAANGKQGLKTCALRPHLIWGPRDRHLVPRLIERARSGQLRRVGDGTNRIDMVHVVNAAHAHLLAADALDANRANGKAYFITQGEPVRCWTWIDEILALAKLPPVKKSISLGAAYAVGAAMEGAYRLLGKQSEPRMTRFLAAQLGMHHWFRISAAERDLGYRPIVSHEQGMQELGESLARA